MSDSSEEKRSAVQVGDPFMEKLLLEACLEVIQCDALVGIQDMGAVGLTSSSAEMASKAGSGIEMNLDLIPQRETGMTAYEMMLSESQERMLLVIERGREQEIVDIFDKYDLEAVSVGHVTDDKMLRLRHNGEVVCELPVDALAEEAPVYHKPSAEPAYYREFQETEVPAPEVKDATETLLPCCSSRQSPAKSGCTINMTTWCAQIRWSLRALTPVCSESAARKALAMTTDCNARYLYLDPEEGGKIAVAEAARNIVCSGAEPLAVTDNLNFGNPEKPEIFWQIEKAVRHQRGVQCSQHSRHRR